MYVVISGQVVLKRMTRRFLVENSMGNLERLTYGQRSILELVNKVFITKGDK